MAQISQMREGVGKRVAWGEACRRRGLGRASMKRNRLHVECRRTVNGELNAER
jgi:hypothetical protein